MDLLTRVKLLVEALDGSASFDDLLLEEVAEDADTVEEWRQAALEVRAPTLLLAAWLAAVKNRPVTVGLAAVLHRHAGNAVDEEDFLGPNWPALPLPGAAGILAAAAAAEPSGLTAAIALFRHAEPPMRGCQAAPPF